MSLRKQQRPFVVEVKSSRRRQLTRPKSIWGNTNLKAFAIEADSDQRALADPISLASVSGVAGEGDNIELTPDVSAVAASENPPSLVSNDVENLDEQEPKKVASSFPDVSTVLVRERVPDAGQKPQRRRSATPTIERGHSEPDELSLGTSDVEQLPELEAENRRLKKMLHGRLVADNRLLREMLARFAT